MNELKRRIEELERVVAELAERNGIAFGAQAERRATAPAGESNGNARLTAAQVREAKRARAIGRTFVEIAEAFGVHESTVRRAVSGKSWRAA